MIAREVRKTNAKLTSALRLPRIRRKFYVWRSLAPEVVQPPFNLRLPTERTTLATSPGRWRFMQPHKSVDDPDNTTISIIPTSDPFTHNYGHEEARAWKMHDNNSSLLDNVMLSSQSSTQSN